MTDEQDALEALQESKNQSRASSPAGSDTDAEPDPSLEDAVAEAFENDIQSTLSFRDQKTAALLNALEATDQLETVANDAAAHLGRNTEDTGKSDVIRLLLRVGLETVDEEIVEAGRDGYRQHQLSQAEEF